MIGKKTTPLAVNRNRIKRLIRESFRHCLDQKIGVDLVIICRPAVNRSRNDELAGSLKVLWRKLTDQVLDNGNG